MAQEKITAGPLTAHRLGAARYQVPEPGVPRSVGARSPAIEIMTDLHRVPAATVSGTLSLDDARRAMVLRGVRMVFIVDDARAVVGLITATDLLGEKPVTYARERGVKVADLIVSDIMTPVDSLDAFTLADVLNACVGDVVEALRALGRQHALVIESADTSDTGALPAIRGIFSASQIARQMGVPPFGGELARTFAEIEAAIGH